MERQKFKIENPIKLKEKIEELRRLRSSLGERDFINPEEIDFEYLLKIIQRSKELSQDERNTLDIKIYDEFMDTIESEYRFTQTPKDESMLGKVRLELRGDSIRVYYETLLKYEELNDRLIELKKHRELRRLDEVIGDKELEVESYRR